MVRAHVSWFWVGFVGGRLGVATPRYVSGMTSGSESDNGSGWILAVCMLRYILSTNRRQQTD